MNVLHVAATVVNHHVGAVLVDVLHAVIIVDHDIGAVFVDVSDAAIANHVGAVTMNDDVGAAAMHNVAVVNNNVRTAANVSRSHDHWRTRHDPGVHPRCDVGSRPSGNPNRIGLPDRLGPNYTRDDLCPGKQRLAMAVGIKVQSFQVPPISFKDHQRADIVPTP